MDELEDQFFGKQYQCTSPPPEAAKYLQLHIQNPPETINIQQNIKTPCILAKAKFRLPKRQKSIEQEVVVVQKSTVCRSITTTQDNSESCEYQSSFNRKNKSHHLQLHTLDSENVLPCPLCAGQKGKLDCFACRGEGTTTGCDNFSKFFQYAMEFKLGQKGSYENRKTKENTKTGVNQFCGDFFKSQQLTSSSYRRTIVKAVAKSSINSETPRCKVDFEAIKQKISEKASIYECYQYECDECCKKLAESTRFHCSEIECNGDFDLCGDCYLRVGHRHAMEEVKWRHQILQKFEQMSKNLQKKVKGKEGMRIGERMSGRIFYSSIH